MVANIKENGLTTTWKESVFTLGKMVGCIKGSTRMIKSMGTVFIHGLIKECTKGCGTKESSTVWEYIQCQVVILSSAYGRMESV
jgi:hypothetical protein